MRLLKSLLLVFLMTQSALPCAWITGTKYNGKRGEVSPHSGVRTLQNALQRNPRPDGAQMETELRGKADLDSRNDYAVALMYLGRSKEAVELLQTLEKEQPGIYYTAANLGTAYELSGDNEKALHWIQEGIRRNPDSHDGTEWLHVKILQAKIAQQKSSDYFKKHSVLGFRPEDIHDEIVIDGEKFPVKEVQRAIEYQLAERLQFVKPRDPAVASLLFDYAAIEAAINSMETAKGVLKMAMEFGYPRHQIEPWLSSYDWKIRWAAIKFYTPFGLGCLAVIGYFVFRCKGQWYKFAWSSKDLKR